MEWFVEFSFGILLLSGSAFLLGWAGIFFKDLLD